MRGGKDDEKIMGPLFPRLHVNDTEKGGPLAPPRNKMALYEQLSVPSQRFNPGGPVLPHPPLAANSMLPSASSSQGTGHERTVFPSFYFPSNPLTHSTKKLCPRSSEGMNVNNTLANSEIKSTTNSSSIPSNFKGQFSQTAEHTLLCLQDLSTSKTSYGKKYGDEDDFCVPTFVHSRAPNGQDEERQTPLCTINPGQATVAAANSARKSVRATCNSSQLQDLNNKPLKRNNPSELKARQYGSNTIDISHKDILANKSSIDKTSSRASNGDKIIEPSRCAKESFNESIPRDSVNKFENAGSLGRPLQDQNTDRANVLRMRSKQGIKTSLANCYRDLHEEENCSIESEENLCGSRQVSNGERNDDSESSMVDCVPVMEISPDDVVGIIGQKHFWKARRAIVNQQKAFAFQVFELHRLIKVQRLIAGSPHMLLDDYPFLKSPKVSSKKILPLEKLLKPLPPETKEQKDDSQRMSQTTECLSNNLARKLPIPSGENGVHRGIASQTSSYGHYMPNMPVTPMGSDNKAGLWCSPSWLVPVMSPAEGLIFKPYTGPCPPPRAFMPPVYGSCSPLSLPHMAGDFMGHAYGVPAPPQQQRVGVISGSPNYYPPYGFPVMNPCMSTAAVELVNMMSVSCPSHGQAEQLSTGEANFNVNSRVSRNTGNRKREGREGIASSGLRPRSSKDSEVHGSTASSPCDNGQGGGHISDNGNPLPLFPMAPATDGSAGTPLVQNSNQQARVIKVVPHNRRSASESAARIFQSIQEERQQPDLHLL